MDADGEHRLGGYFSSLLAGGTRQVLAVSQIYARYSLMRLDSQFMTDIRRAESVSDSPVLGSFTCPTTIWVAAHQPDGHSESHWPRDLPLKLRPSMKGSTGRGSRRCKVRCRCCRRQTGHPCHPRRLYRRWCRIRGYCRNPDRTRSNHC